MREEIEVIDREIEEGEIDEGEIKRKMKMKGVNIKEEEGIVEEIGKIESYGERRERGE